MTNHEPRRYDRYLFKHTKRSPSSAHAAQGTKVRLNFSTVKERYPELATTTYLLRERVMELRTNFQKDAQSALKWYKITTIVALASSATAILIIQQDWLNDFYSFFLIILAVVSSISGGILKGFGWHKRYQSMFAAQWELTALRARIDQDIISFIQSSADPSQLREDERVELLALTSTWNNTLTETLRTFGATYGDAITPTKTSDIVEKIKPQVGR